MLTSELLIHVQLAKELVVHLVHHHKNAVHAMAREWKRLKPVHSLCVQLVERAMVDVKRSRNRAMNVLEKEKQHKRNQRLYQSQLVGFYLIEKSRFAKEISIFRY